MSRYMGKPTTWSTFFNFHILHKNEHHTFSEIADLLQRYINISDNVKIPS